MTNSLSCIWPLPLYVPLLPPAGHLQSLQWLSCVCWAQCGSIFGCFQFDERTIVMSYLFTIFASLQGVMLFVMHCLFSKQVGSTTRHTYHNLHRLLPNNTVPSGFRWEMSTEASCLDVVHRRRRLILSLTTHIQANHKWELNTVWEMTEKHVILKTIALM